jgi:enoyl-CoA hydratase/carnithine racemase
MNAEQSAVPELPFVRRAADTGVVTLTLDRAAQFNPLSRGMLDALEAELERVANDPQVRVVVLCGAGRGFCAGHDLRELRTHRDDPLWQEALFATCARVMLRLTTLRVPVIAQVQGIATAAGCQLVSMCDLAVASESATFALPGVNVGIFCSTPAVGVVRNIGRKHAMEMLLTGEPISASQALSWGLVNRVVPAARLEAEVRELATRIAARSAAVVKLGKSAFYAQSELDLEAAYRLASASMCANLGLADASEGIEAFLGKRPPEWRDA